MIAFKIYFKLITYSEPKSLHTYWFLNMNKIKAQKSNSNFSNNNKNKKIYPN